MDEKILLACSTFPDPGTARRIAHQLVTDKFAACANIIPAVKSVYRWQEKIETAQETLVFFKTTEARYAEFQDKLKSLHPYAVPEIICLAVSDGLPKYLRWVSASCSP